MPKIKPFENPIYVTRPFLPPISKFHDGLNEIWNNHWLTNKGPIVRRFESFLKRYIGVENLCLFTNGTLALQIGLQGMGITGEVITTPFTFVATTHALYWNNIRPVFCDIEPDFYTIDPEKIEEKITPWTKAILAVHVFGHPCYHQKLRNIADRYNIKLIYDSAHAFGVNINDKSIGLLGDLSMFSFHATKPFHSVEGGMLIFNETALGGIFNYLKNFGFKNENEVVMPGTNAKMNELQALMGLNMLEYIDEIVSKQKLISKTYRECLRNLPGIKFCHELDASIKPNFAYVPVEVDEKEFGLSRNDLYDELKTYNVYSRKYFSPLITDYACYRNLAVSDDLKISKRVAKTILTLPTYYDLALDDVIRICEIIKNIHNK